MPAAIERAGLEVTLVEVSDERAAAARELQRLVAANLLGRKSGRGLYDYA